MANSTSAAPSIRFPQLVSFIGQTGAGKSTLVRMLIDQQERELVSAGMWGFPSPVVGSVSNDNAPTSGDVHLYSDPATYLGRLPILYADCEGLEGGENTPLGVRYRETDSTKTRKRSESNADQYYKRRHRVMRGPPRDIAWANSPETRKRQYAVTELYPRLLYTFSDVIVFVLRNPK